jgi:two-component system cell cycle response regulator
LDDRDARLRGIEAGADDFVSKPFDRVELRARVRTTARLNRYRRLLAERTRFEWAIGQAEDGYVIVDEADQVVYANPQARVYLGLVGQEAFEPETGLLPYVIGEGHRWLGSEFLAVARKQYHCEPQEAWKAWPHESASERQAPLFLVRPEEPTANAFWLRVDVLDLPPGQERLVRLSDVTGEVAMQRDRRSFHDVVRHKLRTPLTSMVGSLEMVTRLGSELPAEDLRELAAAALKGTRRLRETVEDMLTYLDARTLAATEGPFAFSQLEEIVASIGSSLGIGPVTVSCPEELGQVRTVLSTRAVELALWEILENALKFHPQRAPTVEVSAQWVEGRGVILRIKDDGITLSPEHLGHIWAPYYQGEKYFTGQAEGTGLGLSTVAALVWEVGGTCRAYPRHDKPGLVLELVLPVAVDEDGRQRVPSLDPFPERDWPVVRGPSEDTPRTERYTCG